ncbi:hypothetical protein [Vibrio marisflavi]|uniref:Flagellar protein FliT n=1 Tax=Vibrio marisflavi CECT 7928 TaxID=634439 RepID=A0ABM9A5Q1_9VIBR|nr:hypothetical protein [Vibrio marisflavi]CAH0540039.1 hypothetical protein VMF7928_02585 [Vibrio marisflavi CECT 7928]
MNTSSRQLTKLLLALEAAWKYENLDRFELLCQRLSQLDISSIERDEATEKVAAQVAQFLHLREQDMKEYRKQLLAQMKQQRSSHSVVSAYHDVTG